MEIDDFDRHRSWTDGRLIAAPHARRAREHRDAPRIRHRLRGGVDHAADESGNAASFSLPARSPRAAARHRILPVVDVFFAGGKLAEINRLAADRLRNLFQLWKIA